MAGIDLSDRSIEHHAKCIERSHMMLELLDTSIDLLRTKHKNGENYYWLLYYTFLSPQQLRNVEEVIEKLCPHIWDISAPITARDGKLLYSSDIPPMTVTKETS